MICLTTLKRNHFVIDQSLQFQIIFILNTINRIKLKIIFWLQNTTLWWQSCMFRVIIMCFPDQVSQYLDNTFYSTCCSIIQLPLTTAAVTAPL